MDYTNNNSLTPTLAPLDHHKIKWILVFIACLIIIIALVTVFKKKQDVVDQNVPSSEQLLLESMSAKGPSVITDEQKKQLEKEMTAKGKSVLSPEQSVKLQESMSAK